MNVLNLGLVVSHAGALAREELLLMRREDARVNFARLGRWTLRLCELVVRPKWLHRADARLYFYVGVADRTLLAILQVHVVDDHVLRGGRGLHNLRLKHLLMEVLAVPQLVLLHAQAKTLVVVMTH